jgi:DNA-directed RNA polymerase specialized sigma24 family protein
VLGNEATAEDVTLDEHVQAIRRPADFWGEPSVQTWL